MSQYWGKEGGTQDITHIWGFTSPQPVHKLGPRAGRIIVALGLLRLHLEQSFISL